MGYRPAAQAVLGWQSTSKKRRLVLYTHARIGCSSLPAAPITWEAMSLEMLELKGSSQTAAPLFPQPAAREMSSEHKCVAWATCAAAQRAPSEHQ